MRYFLRLFFLSLILFFVPVSTVSKSQADSGIVQTKKNGVPASFFFNGYDLKFRKYHRMYFPPLPFRKQWVLLKAQCYAESAFNELAVSPVGALGLCQFMPKTWEEVEQEIGVDANPLNAEYSIMFSAYYMAKLRRGWIAPRPEYDRYSLALASYNAGFGNLLKSQRKCGMANKYDDIIACLPDVTGKNSEETITYVEKIWKFYYLGQ